MGSCESVTQALTPTMKALWLLLPAALASAASVPQIIFQNNHQLPDRAHGAAQAKPTTVYRPRSLDAFHRARLRSLHYAQSELVEWDAVDTLGPDVEHRHTLIQLARMAGNAYALPGSWNWYDVDDAWNTVRASPRHAPYRSALPEFPARLAGFRWLPRARLPLL